MYLKIENFLGDELLFVINGSMEMFSLINYNNGAFPANYRSR